MSGISDKTVNVSVCASGVLMCQQCYGLFKNLLQEQVRLVVVGKTRCSFFLSLICNLFLQMNDEYE